MDRSRFYELIDEAREGTEPLAPSADAEELGDVLDRLDDDELLGFVAAFEAELVRLNRWAIWDAGYVADGGMSDDSFHYFRSWLIGKGRDAVDRALEDPDGLVEFLGDEDELENEELEYVALELLEERGIDDERADPADVDGDPEGEVTDAETADARYPRLAAWAAG